MDFKSVMEKYPGITNSKSMLYIGFDPKYESQFVLFKEVNWEITILEINPKNVEWAKKNLEYNVVEGDVRDIDQHFSINQFDIIIWEDGIEHIEESEWKSTFEKLDRIAKKFVVLESPEGRYGHEGAILEWNKQHSEVYVDKLKEYGFDSWIVKEEHKGNLVNRVRGVKIL